jgi:hypothetical protein
MRELAVDSNATGGDDRPTFKKSMNQLSDMGKRQFGKEGCFLKWIRASTNKLGANR